MTTFRPAHTDPFEEYVVATSTFAGARRLAGDVAAVRADYEAVWDRLTREERAQIVDEAVIRPEAALRYQGGAPSRPGLPFGACQVYPRLRHPVGMKTMMVEDTAGSQGEDLDSASSGCTTYTYQDEHSAPFSWRTRSQQDLAFEFGRPASMASEDLDHNGLEILSASPSKILGRPPPANLSVARMSRGNPSFAKAAHIPIVPTIPRPERPPERSDHVPPEQINNFVYESAPNRLVLDFSEFTLNPDGGGDPEEEEEDAALRRRRNASSTPRTSSPESNKSAKSLLSKMKRSLAPSLSNLRKKSGEERPRPEVVVVVSDQQHKRLSASVSSPAAHSSSSTSTSADKSRQSLQVTSVCGGGTKLVKPSVAPPPPPPMGQTLNKRLDDKPEVDVETSKPLKQHPPPAPAPPVRTVSQRSFNREEAEGKDISGNGVAELDDFKIDLKTETELPKTGFDFLDNW